MDTYHAKSKLFTLIGRRIILHEPYYSYTEGIIVEQIGPARFGCYLQAMNGKVYMSGIAGRPVTVDFHRSEFILPPLPKCDREPEWLNGNYDGFVYKDSPGFINPYCRYK